MLSYSATVELSEDFWAQTKFLQSPEEEEMLVGLPHYWLCVVQVRSTVMFTAEELEAADPLHWSPVDGDGGVLTGPPPEIHHQLFGLTDVQREVVVVAPVSQGVHLFSVGWFITVGIQTYHRCVTCKFEDHVGAVHGYTVMRVQGVQERAEKTALRCSSVEGQREGDVAAYSDHLPSACQINQDPASQRIVQT